MKNFTYTITGKKNFNETVDIVSKVIESHTFTILKTHDVQATFAKKGLEHDPYKIIEFCRGPKAKKILDADPQIGLFLPCKIIVYEIDGKVTVSALRPIIIHDFFPNAELGDTPEIVDTDIEAVVQEIDLGVKQK